MLITSPDNDFFQAAQTLAQSLSQWALLTVGGSLVVIVGTSYYRPKSHKMRLAYFLFLPAWVLLGIAIYEGTLIQRRYVAFLAANRRGPNPGLINEIAQGITSDSGYQILFLQLGLLSLFIWLVIYLRWWIFSDEH